MYTVAYVKVVPIVVVSRPGLVAVLALGWRVRRGRDRRLDVLDDRLGSGGGLGLQ